LTEQIIDSVKIINRHFQNKQLTL